MHPPTRTSPTSARRKNARRTSGSIGAAFGIGFVLGPSIGGLLGSFGPRTPFFVAAGLALLNATFGLFAVPESLPRERRRAFEWSRANPFGTLMQLRKHPVVVGLAGVSFLWLLGHQVLPSTWAFYTMLRFDWSAGSRRLFARRFGHRHGDQPGRPDARADPEARRRTARRIGRIVERRAVYCCYAFASHGWVLYVGIIGWGLAAMSWPSLNALMSQQIPANAQGELQGGLASLSSVAGRARPAAHDAIVRQVLGPGGAVYFPGAPFFAAALLALASAVILLQVSKRPRQVALAPE